MNENPTLMDRLDTLMERFTERERKLLIVMVISVGTMLCVLIGYNVSTTLADIQEEITEKREALDLLVSNREEFQVNSSRNSMLREQLADNSVRLSTFIEGKSGRASMGRPREFRDNEFDLDGGVTMRSTTAEWASVEPDQVFRFLNSIEADDELVYVRQVAVTPARRAEGLELEVTLVTYDQAPLGSEEDDE